MSTLIRGGRIESDSWRLLEAADGPVGAHEPVIVPLDAWRARRGEFVRRGGALGVLLEPADDPGAIQGDLACIALVAVRFPQFTDGRGYSIARMLRGRLGWKGELRAVGDVQRDQLSYLRRCGFDSFSLRAGEDPVAALAAFDDFSEAYQEDAARPPLYRRRAA